MIIHSLLYNYYYLHSWEKSAYLFKSVTARTDVWGQLKRNKTNKCYLKCNCKSGGRTTWPVKCNWWMLVSPSLMVAGHKDPGLVINWDLSWCAAELKLNHRLCSAAAEDLKKKKRNRKKKQKNKKQQQTRAASSSPYWCNLTLVCKRINVCVKLLQCTKQEAKCTGSARDTTCPSLGLCGREI